MYKALVSFTTKDYDIKQGQILPDDFTTATEIQDFLSNGYIRVYNPSEEGVQSETINNIWTGTQAEYSAITTLNDNTLYFIKED